MSNRITPDLGHTSRCGHATQRHQLSAPDLAETTAFFSLKRLLDLSMGSDNAESLEKSGLSGTDTQSINIQLDSGDQHVKYRRRVWQLWCVFFPSMTMI